MDVDERRQCIVVFSVLDSMGKGGAHAVGLELAGVEGKPLQ